MIILKILLYVILAVLGIIAMVLILALVLPVKAEISFINGEFRYRLNFSFLKLMDSDGKGFLKRKKKNKKSDSADHDDDYEGDFSGYDDCEGFQDDNDINIDVDIYEEKNEIPDEQEEDFIRSEKISKIKEKKSHNHEEDTIPEEPEENYTDMFYDEQEDNDDDDDDNDDDKDSGKSLTDKIDFIFNIWDIGGRPLLKLFKGFHIKNVFIDFIVANEDAYKCAVHYGHISSIVYNFFAWLGELFTLSYKTVDIQCGFASEKSQWDCSCKISFRFYTLVISGLWFLMTYIFKILLPRKLRRKKSKK